MATIEKPAQHDTCEQEDLVIFNATRELDGEEGEQFAAHLLVCARCQWLQDQTKLEIDKVGLKRYGLKLKEPPDSHIPLQNNPEQIQACKEYFAPMINELSQWCQTNGIIIDRTLPFTGEIIVNATPAQMEQLQAEAERLGFFDGYTEKPFTGGIFTPSRPQPSSQSETRPA